MRFCIINEGCKVNRVEAEAFVSQLRAAGAISSSESEADLIVVNTCTVTAEAEKKARKATHHALRANDYADVVVTGCASAINAEEFSSMDTRVRVVPKSDMSRFLDTYVDAHNADTPDKLPDTAGDAALPYHMRSRTRVGVKIQDGCDNACTYCIVHVARGHSVSRDEGDVVNECVSAALSGAREIILTGINVGSYESEGNNLAALLSRLLDETADLPNRDEYPVRFRLSSIEPVDVSADLVSLIAQARGRICRHLHIPLQSGSSKVLLEMARLYDVQEFVSLVSSIRDSMPEIALTTDIIVGFPGESEDDFYRTLDVARTCAFSNIHVFPYSARAGTPAADRTDQVSLDVRRQRASDLRSLARDLRREDFATRSGTSELALVIDGTRALTESYYEITPPSDVVQGVLVPCVL